MTSESLDSSHIRAAFQTEDYETVIKEVREAFDIQPTAAVNDPFIQTWLGLRFRNLFLQEAMTDDDAVKHAQAPFPLNKADKRPERQRVAERYFRYFNPDELDYTLPASEVEKLPERTLLFAPGLLTGLLPVLAFQSVWPHIKDRFGLRIVASDSHPGRSSKANVADLLNVIEKGIGVSTDLEAGFITADDDPQPIEGDFVAMGYSKGGPDILTLLVEHPELAPRVKGIVGWAGAFGGSYAANDILQQLARIPDIEIVGKFDSSLAALLSRMAPIVNASHLTRRLSEYNVREAIESLTTTFRDTFNDDHSQTLRDFNIPGFYFTGSTSVVEVPYFQKQGTLDLDHYDQDNDMQLIQAQASLPGHSTRLAMFHANHWDLSYDPFPWYETAGSQHLKNPFPRQVAMVSIVQLLGELGILR